MIGLAPDRAGPEEALIGMALPQALQYCAEQRWVLTLSATGASDEGEKRVLRIVQALLAPDGEIQATYASFPT